MDMNFEKNASVKFEDYTKSFLQSDSDPATMEVVTRTNAVKSPTNSPETTKLVYTVKAKIKKHSVLVATKACAVTVVM